MTLDELVRIAAAGGLKGLVHDSRQVQAGFAFVAMRGFKTDGHRYIADAVARGAGVVVAEEDFAAPPGVEKVLVADARHALSALADAYYGRPSSRIKMVGITGTNGKTTVAYLVKAMAEEMGLLPGTIGTAGMTLGETVLEEKAANTTPESLSLQWLLSEMVRGGGQVCAMEVTSHALDLHRVDHCHFDVAVFTNLTHEHLDWHKDMEAYFQSKARLFAKLLAPGATAVLNLNDPYGRRLAAMLPPGVRCLTYGFGKEADLRATRILPGRRGCSFRLYTPEGSRWVRMPHLFGRYNVENALAALGAARALGWSLDAALRALGRTKGAPGRFEHVEMGQDFDVIVDYAHTPDGFQKLLENVVRLRRPGARIVMVFGSAGERDHSKRPDMGRIAGDFCDLLVLTEEDPRSEDAMQIAREIASGVQNPLCEVVMIEDRVEAIERAVELARPGDIILITGKGNEALLEVRHPTTWHGDVPAARQALGRRLARKDVRAV